MQRPGKNVVLNATSIRDLHELYTRYSVDLASPAEALEDTARAHAELPSGAKQYEAFARPFMVALIDEAAKQLEGKKTLRKDELVDILATAEERIFQPDYENSAVKKRLADEDIEAVRTRFFPAFLSLSRSLIEGFDFFAEEQSRSGGHGGPG